MRAHPSIKISPRARRALRCLALDPLQLTGSGPTGRIVEADVLRTGAAGTVASSARGNSQRRVIAARTLANFTRVPHFYLRAEADATLLMAERERLVAGVEKSSAGRITVTDFLLAAQSRALADCPWANAIWGQDDVQPCAGVHVGLVVAVEGGLLIPVLRDVDKLTVAEIARKRAELVEQAGRGRLGASQCEGGASSLSNLGRSRTDEFAAIINQPQSTMLAVGRIALRPWVSGGKLGVAPTVKLTLSVDHRVLDGEPAARFLDRIIDGIENPAALLAPRART